MIVLNTCVVRQSAENKAYGRLSSIKPLKQKNPDLVINLMGCLVGMKPDPRCLLVSHTWMFFRLRLIPIRFLSFYNNAVTMTSKWKPPNNVSP